MALCLGQSLIDKVGFDSADQLDKYLKWYKQGYMSSINTCFDIGLQTATALNYYEQTGDPHLAGYAGRRSDGSVSAGNGALMRLAPVPIYYYPKRELVWRYAGMSSLTTHANPLSIDCCQIFALLLCQAFDGVEKRAITTNPLLYNVKAHVIGMDIEDVKTSGYVLDTIRAAVWCFARTNSFKEAVLLAANLGDDADTTAAVVGQLAGAYYGIGGITDSWLEKLVKYDLINEVVDSLCYSR
jgi:ADP-ribosyl-[dinitrogen reductase] hydrolase